MTGIKKNQKKTLLRMEADPDSFYSVLSWTNLQQQQLEERLQPSRRNWWAVGKHTSWWIANPGPDLICQIRSFVTMTNRDNYKEAELRRSPRLNLRATPTEGMRSPLRRLGTIASQFVWLGENSNYAIYHLLWTIAVTISSFQTMISMARTSMTENAIHFFL